MGWSFPWESSCWTSCCWSHDAQDFKTGYTTLASPWSMFVSQVIGTAIGCIVAPCVFCIIYKAFPDLGTVGSQYPAPNVTIFRGIAILGVEGFSSLPKHCLTLCYVFSIAATAINVFFIAATVINGLRGGVWTLSSSILALAGVKPPICMKFLSRNTNANADTWIISLVS